MILSSNLHGLNPIVMVTIDFCSWTIQFLYMREDHIVILALVQFPTDLVTQTLGCKIS